MRLISVDEMRCGDKLAQNLVSADGVLMLAGGAVLTEQRIAAIKKMGLYGAYIDDELSEGIETAPMISDKVLYKLLKALSTLDIESIVTASEELVDNITEDAYENDMLMLKNYDNYTAQHSINVAVYATILARCLGLSEREVKQVAQAGILHDIGKLVVPKEIINKPERLTDAEFEQVKLHSQFGYNQLKNRVDIWSVVRVAVLEHHENENGTGYPRGITGKEIHTIGKIIHIADVYDALVTRRSYKDGWAPKRAMKYITENKGVLFDAQFAEVFSHCLPMYLKGTVVLLSDGRKAVVMKNYSRDSTRPKVRTLDGEIVDLIEERKLSIVDNADLEGIDVSREIHIGSGRE